MPLTAEFSRPVMRAATCFHAYQHRWVLGEECQHLASPQGLAQHRLLCPINAVDLKDIFCQINANCLSFI
jgi:hypothetical protein